MAFVDVFAQAGPGGAVKQTGLVVPWDGNAPNAPALTGNGNGSWLNVNGINGYINLEVTLAGSGSCSVSVNGTLDASSKASNSSAISPVRYAVLGSSGALSPVVAGTAISTPSTIWLAVLDGFASLALNITSASGTFSVTSRALLFPQ